MRAALAAIGVLVALAGSVSTGSGPAAADVEPPAPGTIWFGPALDWRADSVDAYTARLGAAPSLVGTAVGYPLTETSLALLDDASTQSARAGAVGVVALEPTDVARLDAADAVDLAAAVARVTARDGSRLLLDFGPEMNGPSAPWARRPLTYVAAFRAVADAVHAATDDAALLWSPLDGAGYPFVERDGVEATSALGVGSDAPGLDRRNVPYLDTDGDGTVTGLDDPYGPYFPGEEAVDWVGLVLLRPDGSRPVPGEVEARLRPAAASAPAPPGSFYDRFAASTGLPMLLTTAAAGIPDAVVKRAWLRQVLDAAGARPQVAAVQWVERSLPVATDRASARYQVSADLTLASRVRADLEQGPVELGPVPGVGGGDRTDPESDHEADPVIDRAAAAAPEGGARGPFLAGVATTLVVVGVSAAAALRVRRRRAVPPWLR